MNIKSEPVVVIQKKKSKKKKVASCNDLSRHPVLSDDQKPNIIQDVTIQMKRSKKKKVESNDLSRNSVISDDQKPALKRDVCLQKTSHPEIMYEQPSMAEIAEKYPILLDENIVKKFLEVPMTNNQKGRIRQTLKDSLTGASKNVLPEVINRKIQQILKCDSLKDSDLRKLRILYNMLKTATLKSEQKAKVQNISEKRLRRYVVFIGNLPVDTNEDMIRKHFTNYHVNILSIRIPKDKKFPEDKKSSIAYMEVKDEFSYQLALSKHHSMLNNKRINVLYTSQKNSKKIDKKEAKKKVAKMVALRKTGQLVGSVALTRKRSYRRKKQKEAIAREKIKLENK